MFAHGIYEFCGLLILFILCVSEMFLVYSPADSVRWTLEASEGFGNEFAGVAGVNVILRHHDL